MRGWQLVELGEPEDVLCLGDMDDPQPDPDEILIRVEATNVNFADILQCRGTYQEKPELPFTPGVETCGIVVESDRSGRCKVGDRVVGVTSSGAGGYAELALLASRSVLVIPPEVSPEAATVLFTTYQTSHVALHHRARLQPGEFLLVHGASGGVGSSAVQLGIAAGATVIATAGGVDKVEYVKSLRAHHVIDSHHADVYEEVMSITGGRGVDVAYDAVGGELGDLTRRMMAWEGRLLIIGFATGAVPSYPANHALVKNYSIIGLYWGSYLTLERRHVVEHAHDQIMAAYQAGRLDPPKVEKVDLTDLLGAFERIRLRKVSGRLAVKP
ncbi:MAG: NADPH:quinone oxidoreductase family protein [Actinomycetia bacterium]|nr:NADPH:quinone oxidoreductase family protein [Actinomycetes bacterium]MCP4960010.1 NADPH:quinone oxidoreductase family protein [Actinomycetes bacterium]